LVAELCLEFDFLPRLARGLNVDNLAKNPKTRHPPTQHQEVTNGAGVG
jgi:hypothetical protein